MKETVTRHGIRVELGMLFLILACRLYIYWANDSKYPVDYGLAVTMIWAVINLCIFGTLVRIHGFHRTIFYLLVTTSIICVYDALMGFHHTIFEVWLRAGVATSAVMFQVAIVRTLYTYLCCCCCVQASND